MIPKISCYNQNFSAAGLPSSRVNVTRMKPVASLQSLSAAEFIRDVRHCDCKLGTGIGSILGAGAAFFAALSIKADAGTWLALHSGGMTGGGVIGRKVHNFLSK